MDRDEKFVYGILGAIGIGILVYIVVLGITGAVDLIGGAATANGWNIIDGLHIHKSFFGLLAIIAGLYIFEKSITLERDKKYLWFALSLALIGVIIVSFDYAVFGVILPITEV
jgi:hypothetical protein